MALSVKNARALVDGAFLAPPKPAPVQPPSVQAPPVSAPPHIPPSAPLVDGQFQAPPVAAFPPPPPPAPPAPAAPPPQMPGRSPVIPGPAIDDGTGNLIKPPPAAQAAPSPPAAPAPTPPAGPPVVFGLPPGQTGPDFNAILTAAAAAAGGVPGAPGAPGSTPDTGAPPASSGADSSVGSNGSSSSSSSAAKGPSLDDLMALINSNPVLAQTKLLNEKRGKTAASTEAALAKNMLLGYGSQDLARQVLAKLAASDPRLAAELGDIESFVGAKDAKGNALISDNPDTSTSILAQLSRAYRTKARATDEGFNDNGLFFSGARANALNENAYQRQVDQATQRGGLEDKLTAAALGLTNADMESEQAYLDAYQNAYNAALEEALKYGGLGAGGDGGGDAAAAALGGPAAATAGMFSGLNNLSPTDWAKIAALPVNAGASSSAKRKKTASIAGGAGGGGRSLMV